MNASGGGGPSVFVQKHFHEHHMSFRESISQTSPVSRHIVLMRMKVINLWNRVPEHDSLTFFRAPQNEM